MVKRILVSLALAVAGAAHAASIARVISPVSLVLTSSGAREVTALDGKPVLYCGLATFETWAMPLVGQAVRSTPDAGITVSVDARDVSLVGLMVRSGWLQPPELDDDAQAAIAEGRGGWACAKAETPFVLMHTSVDPKVLAGIALNESAYNGRAWPWTLNVAGRGFFFRSRDDAYGAMRALIAAGRYDFDVGIMQVNWRYPVSLAQIELAINHWRDRRPPADAQHAVLCAEARALADVCGLMIYRGEQSVQRSSLTGQQREALAAAL